MKSIKKIQLECISTAPTDGSKKITFIHGIEYESIREITSDFIKPFIESSKLSLECHDIRVLRWHSHLFDVPLFQLSRWRTGRVFLSWFWVRAFRRTQRRAVKLGIRLARHISENPGDLPDIVVTHSLGAKIWVSCIRTLLREGHLQPKDIPSWINLQPAIRHNSLQPGGRYEVVGDAYRLFPERYAMLFSRYDIVLGTFFPLSTGFRAMGHFGDFKSGLPQIDTSGIAKEVHGTVCLSGSQTFYERCAHLIAYAWQHVNHDSIMPNSKRKFI